MSARRPRYVPDSLGPVLAVGTARVKVGSCSWADATLTKDADWYPLRSMTAAERLAYYASRFPVVEVDSTYYFPPTPEVAQSWVDRTPEGFMFDVKAWSLLTGHPTFPHSLFPDLHGEVKSEFLDRKNLYDGHLSRRGLEECWSRFRHALLPLHEAGKLGGVLLQYPDWFSCNPENRARILEAAERLSPYRILVEFRRSSWLENEQCETTLDWLAEHDLTFVCVDEPQGFGSSMPPVLASTAALSIVRFHGHNDENWEKRYITAAERFKYLYSAAELDQWAERLADFSTTTDEVHVLFNNCWQDFGVRNAAEMMERLAGVDSDIGASTVAGTAVAHRTGRDMRLVHDDAGVYKAAVVSDQAPAVA